MSEQVTPTQPDLQAAYEAHRSAVRLATQARYAAQVAKHGAGKE